MPAMTQVYSTSVDSVGYSPVEKELFVQWKNGGKVSVYKGVPADVAVAVTNAWSVGNAVRELVVPRYEHRYQGERDEVL